MCSIASAVLSTIFTASIKSKYSVDQSDSVAGLTCPLALARARARSSPRSSTSLSSSAGTARCKKAGAMPLWTSRVSAALHTATYWVLASTAICTALSRSALASTYTWQIPSAWPMTGILVLCMMYCTNSLLPRGMMRSIRFSSPRRARTSSRPDRSVIHPSGRIPCVAWHIISARVWLVTVASRPPLSRAALPDLRHREAICTRASGRDSKITPITPMGTVTR